MKTFIITESYTGYVEYEVVADSKEEAMKLYNDDIDNCTDLPDNNLDRYDYKFYSIEENK